MTRGKSRSFKEEEQTDSRGVKLGTGVAYDDVYAGGGDDDGEYVSELPTMDEEKKMHADEVRAREDMEELDEGRVANHPSTLAATKGGKVRARSRNLVQNCHATIVSLTLLPR